MADEIGGGGRAGGGPLGRTSALFLSFSTRLTALLELLEPWL